MTATERSNGVRIRGSWPQRVLLTHGWGRAFARPWNEDLAAANLRLGRGGAKFLADVTAVVAEWTTPIISPAILPHRSSLWVEAGYEVVEQLLLFEHDLRRVPPPTMPMEAGDVDQLDELNLIDREAFPPRWRMGRAGLEESLEATTRTIIHVVSEPAGPAGFAITGVGLGIGYLQRLAVAPRAHGQGIGRSLVSASLLWAQRRGAGSLLVNTQKSNLAAASLYAHCGFRPVPEGLSLLSAYGADF